MRFRRGDPGGPLGVVREKEQPFAGFVEPAHGGDPGKIGVEKFVNRVAAFFIGGGGDNAPRLVEQQIDFLGCSDGLAIDFNAVLAEPYGSFWIAPHHTVDANLPRANALSGFRSGAVAKLGESSGQAHHFRVRAHGRPYRSEIATSITLPGFAELTTATTSARFGRIRCQRPIPWTTMAILRFERFC